MANLVLERMVMREWFFGLYVLLWANSLYCPSAITVGIGHIEIETEAYSGPYQTSMMERFYKNSNGWKPLLFLQKRTITDDRLSPKTSWVAKFSHSFRFIGTFRTKKVVTREIGNMEIESFEKICQISKSNII